MCLLKVTFKNESILNRGYESLLITTVYDEKHNFSRLKDLKLFHVQGFVIGEEESSAIVGFIQDGLFYGNIHVGENIYFVDPLKSDDSSEKQRFSKLNDPSDISPDNDQGTGYKLNSRFFLKWS